MNFCLSKKLFLWILMICATGAYAADMPSTLYMEQTSFSSTGRVAAIGSDGVYEFSLTYPQSNTTAPRYYIFSSATSAANAKKGTYVVYGASSISEATLIEPALGKQYQLVDLSSADDATALVGSPHTCAFVPVYCSGATFKVTVNLNTGTVVFERDPAEEAAVTLGIFNKSTTKALATADVVDGKACYSLKVASETTVYFAANTDTRSATNTKPIWGSSSQLAPSNVTVSAGESYPLVRTTYPQVYGNSTCSYVIPAGQYDVIADIDNGTIEFSEFTGRFRFKPATLYMRSNTFGTNYGAAAGEGGVYTFTLDRSTQTTSTPIYVVFTEANSLSSAQSAAWVLGSTADETNITPDFGKTYKLVDVDAAKVNANAVGTFMPVYPQKYTVTVNLNDLEVTFTPVEAPDDMTTLNLLSETFGKVAVSKADAEGKYHFSSRAAQGTKVFLSTAEMKTGANTVGRIFYGAGGHANPVDVEGKYGSTCKLSLTSYRRVVTDKLGFVELPGKCDIEFDPKTGDFVILPYTGAYSAFPETLYMRSNTFGTSYGEATGVDGVYTFEYTTQSFSGTPRKIVFSDATTYKVACEPMSWVLGSSDSGTFSQPYPGLVSKLYDVDAVDPYSNGCGYFIPYAPYTYTVTVNLNDYTVTWGDEVELPSGLNMLSSDLTPVVEAVGGSDGVYVFDTYTYSAGRVFFSEAATRTALQTARHTYYSMPFGSGLDLNVDDEPTSGLWRGGYYQWLYGGYGYWVTPAGCNHVVARLDTKLNTIEWSSTPVTITMPEVLYLTSPDNEMISKAVNDGSGVFDFEVALARSQGVAFSNGMDGTMSQGRMFYGSSVPFDPNRVPPVSGKEYPLYITSPEGVADDDVTFGLAAGSWHIKVDMNTMKITFTDMSRGGQWYTPQSLNMCDDYLNTLSTGTTDGNGVFTFNDVKIDGDGGVNVVFTDPAEGGSIFGANATGELGPKVESSDVYQLYITKKMWVTTDANTCFTLAPSTYDVTVDFNAKTVVFVDPSVPVYPAKMQLVSMGGEDGDMVMSTATQAGKTGVYTFNIRSIDAPLDITFVNPDDTTMAYAPEAGAPAVADYVTVPLEKSAVAVPVKVPAGLWAVTLSLADTTVSFVETPLPRFVSTTMPSGSAFYSYFGVGTVSQAVFRFNTNIASVSPRVVIGDYDGGEPAEGELTALGAVKGAIAENEIVLDFTGQHYSLPEGAEPKVHIVLMSVKDSNGELLVTDNVDGLPGGSIVFEYPFTEFERVMIDKTFDVAPGGNIDEVTTINLRLNQYDKLSFSDVVFTSPDAATPDAVTDDSDEGEPDAEPQVVKVPAQWRVTSPADADGYTTLAIEVPMAIRARGNVELMLDNLTIDDGYDDHSRDVVAAYTTEVDPSAIVTTTPADGESVASIDEITVTWTHPVITSVGNLAPAARIVDADTNCDAQVAPYSCVNMPDDRTLAIRPVTEIAENGSYLVVIDAGHIVFNDRPGDTNNSLAILLNVDTALGVSAITIAPDDDITVVNLSGQVVRKGKGVSTLNGLHGIYIVNGVKCHFK